MRIKYPCGERATLLCGYQQEYSVPVQVLGKSQNEKHAWVRMSDGEVSRVGADRLRPPVAVPTEEAAP